MCKTIIAEIEVDQIDDPIVGEIEPTTAVLIGIISETTCNH